MERLNIPKRRLSQYMITEREAQYQETGEAKIEIKKMGIYVSGKSSNGINSPEGSCNIFKGRGSPRPSPTSSENDT